MYQSLLIFFLVYLATQNLNRKMKTRKEKAKFVELYETLAIPKFCTRFYQFLEHVKTET